MAPGAPAFGGAYLILALAGPHLVGAGDVYQTTSLGLLLGTGPMAAIWVGSCDPYLLAFPVTAVRVSLGHLESADSPAVVLDPAAK
jgi:hypothetical protein